MYLERFLLPIHQEEKIIEKRAKENGGLHPYIDNIYPCGLFKEKDFSEIWFKKVTIFYGGNGSGKSTLLNLIAAKLELNRVAPFNTGELFDAYVKKCAFFMGEDEEGFTYRVPNGSRIIASDDIFDYMLTVRSNNEEIGESIEEAKGDWVRQKYGKTVKVQGMDDIEDLRLQVLARSKSVSRRQYIRRTAGQEVKLISNGQTALEYFRKKLKNDTLYCLDEPENSLSPQGQMQLVALLEELVRYCGCQFIIATHSPFLLAMEGARIYDLDASPVEVRNWWELDHVKTYFAFFEKHREHFLKK